MIKKFLTRCSLMLMSMTAVFIFSLSTEVKAEEKALSGNLTNSDTQSFWFAVPDGGHSSAKVEINIKECYTSMGTDNNFHERNYLYAYTRAGATVTPAINVGRIRHHDSKNNVIAEFSPWMENGIITDWHGGNSFSNFTAKRYAKTTSNTSKVSYLVICKDGYPSPGVGGVTVSLKTQ